MPIYRIPDHLVFPHPKLAEPSGLLGVGGDLRAERLLLGYANGIFPWYSEGQPILWFSPDPRFVLEPSALHVGRSLRRAVRRNRFELRMDTAFDAVIQACKETHRPDQDGTWITEDMEAAYRNLHALGHAHSVEAWLDGELVGGLYGVAVGGMFAGESMFCWETDASKVALVWLVRQLDQWGFGLVDSQVRTETLARMGADDMPRSVYLERLAELVSEPGRPGPWAFDPDFDPSI